MCGSLHVEMRGLCKLNGMVCGQWVCECDGGVSFDEISKLVHSSAPSQAIS